MNSDNYRKCLEQAKEDAPTSDAATAIDELIQQSAVVDSGGGGNTNPPKPGGK